MWLDRKRYFHPEGLTRQDIALRWERHTDGKKLLRSTFRSRVNAINRTEGLVVVYRARRYVLEFTCKAVQAIFRRTFADPATGELPHDAASLALERSRWQLPSVGPDYLISGAADALDEEMVDAINRAITQDLKLCVCYNSPRMGLYETTLAPHFAHWYADTWYVVGFSSRHRQMRTFAVARMERVRGANEHFVRRAGATPRAWYANSFGIYGGLDLEPMHVVVEALTPRAASTLRLHRLHASQRERPILGATERFVTLVPQRRCLPPTFEAEVAVTPDLIAHIRSFGDELRVLSPQCLVSAARA